MQSFGITRGRPSVPAKVDVWGRPNSHGAEMRLSPRSRLPQQALPIEHLTAEDHHIDVVNSFNAATRIRS